MSSKKRSNHYSCKVTQKIQNRRRKKLAVIDTKDGILLKPKKTFWDMIGAYSDPVKTEKIDKLLYKIGHEEEDV